MNEVESSRDIVHNPSPLMTRLAIMWHDNRRFFWFWKWEEDVIQHMMLSIYQPIMYMGLCYPPFG